MRVHRRRARRRRSPAAPRQSRLPGGAALCRALGDSSCRLALLAAPWAYAAAGAACTISATGVPFGSYDPQSGSVVDGAGTINVGCHPSDAAPTVSLSAGNSGTFAARTMLSGGNSLDYNLYTTSARNVVWGDGFGGSVP